MLGAQREAEQRSVVGIGLRPETQLLEPVSDAQEVEESRAPGGADPRLELLDGGTAPHLDQRQMEEGQGLQAFDPVGAHRGEAHALEACAPPARQLEAFGTEGQRDRDAPAIRERADGEPEARESPQEHFLPPAFLGLSHESASPSGNAALLVSVGARPP